MGALRIHGTVLSPGVMRVLACLHEKGLDYEHVQIDMMAGEHKKEAFLAINPFGQVPAFEDGDLKIWESRAITRYIATEYSKSGTELFYEDSKAMALLNVGLEVEAHQFDPPASQLAWELIIKMVFGLTTDRDAVKEHEAKLAKVLDVYEARLTQSKYIAGDEYSLADLNHIPNMHYLMNTQIKELFDSRPHVSAWRADIMARPSWLKVAELLKDAKPSKLLSS